MIIVNGPIAKEIRLNSGFGLLGPDPQHPAGASIGRALRLLQQNVGGALAGVGTMAIFGGMRYTNAVFPEDEDGFPEDWRTVSEDRRYLPWRELGDGLCWHRCFQYRASRGRQRRADGRRSRADGSQVTLAVLASTTRRAGPEVRLVRY